MDLPVEDPVEDADTPAPSKQAVEVTAEVLADEEWGPVKEKKNKDKKGKKKGKAAAEEEEEEIPRVDMGKFSLPSFIRISLTLRR